MKQRLRSSALPWLTLLVALIQSACSETPTTGLLVAVHAEDEVAAELHYLRVLLYDSEATDEARFTESRRFELESAENAGGYTLPLSFRIEKGRAERLLLVVQGFRRGSAEPVIEHKLLAGFRSGRTELLRVLLGAACYELSEPCQSLAETCYPLAQQGVAAGACGDVQTVTTEAVSAGEELDANIPWQEPMDAGPPDAAADGGEPNAEPDDGASPVDAGDVGRSPESGATGCLDGSAAPCACDAGSLRDEAGGCVPDYCTLQPCLNGGHCTANDSGRSCDCSAIDYRGSSCEERIDDCAPSPCQHAGRCTDGLRSFTCNCDDTGFSEAQCNRNVNECTSPNVCVGTTNGVAFSYVCEDATGDNVGYSCKGLFADWPLTEPPNRFSASGGVVNDAKTKLSWQEVLDPDSYTAIAAASYCAGLSLAGGRFRMPTRAELESLVDLTTHDPAIAPPFRLGTPATSFWTSSAWVGVGGGQWIVNFSDGSLYYHPQSFLQRVRCVRDNP